MHMVTATGWQLTVTIKVNRTLYSNSELKVSDSQYQAVLELFYKGLLPMHRPILFRGFKKQTNKCFIVFQLLQLFQWDPKKCLVNMCAHFYHCIPAAFRLHHCKWKLNLALNYFKCSKKTKQYCNQTQQLVWAIETTRNRKCSWFAFKKTT